MKSLKTQCSVARKRELTHDIEHLERGATLRIRRNFIHLPAAIIRLDRLNPLCLVLAQVLSADDSAKLLRRLHDRAGNTPLVEGLLAFACNQFQSPGILGITENFPQLRRPSSREVDARRFRI